MSERESRNADHILRIEEMIQRAGNNQTYQLKMLLNFFLVFLFSSFIQMGFPIIFQPAQFVCEPGEDCSEAAVCARGEHVLSPDFKSVAYSFDLVCSRKGFLRRCFESFLVGGFLGSLYFGEIIERYGRKHAVLQSLLMMIGGLYLSCVSGSAWIFSLGVFFFNAGFRGFYNASLLSISQVTGEVTRAATPMVFSIGWALGQILIAFICMVLFNWRIIFLLTAIPLTVLFYFAYYQVKESPRFAVTKHDFPTAKSVVEQIAYINGRRMVGYQLKEEIQYKSRMQSYEKILQGGNISSRQTHHSYLSLLKFNSIRIRVIIVSIIWSIISLSYFMSAKNQLNPHKSYTFNIAFAGVIEIIAYLISMITSLNYGRVFVIKRLLIASAIVHLCYYFIQPHDEYTGFSKAMVLMLDIIVRMLMSFGNTFLAIYSIQLFPTSIRHFALGILGFITKLMYMLSFIFSSFFSERFINPNFIIGILLAGSYFFTVKLRETKQTGFKDNLSEDGNSLLMNETVADIF